MPVADECFQGSIRKDGRGMFPAYLFQVKKPSESKAKWDYYNLLQTTSGEDVYKPFAASTCSFVKA